jgi:hypothetical protein
VERHQDRVLVAGGTTGPKGLGALRAVVFVHEAIDHAGYVGADFGGVLTGGVGTVEGHGMYRVVGDDRQRAAIGAQESDHPHRLVGGALGILAENEATGGWLIPIHVDEGLAVAGTDADGLEPMLRLLDGRQHPGNHQLAVATVHGPGHGVRMRGRNQHMVPRHCIALGDPADRLFVEFVRENDHVGYDHHHA